MSRDEILQAINKFIEQGGRYHEQGQHVLSLTQYQKAIELAAPLGDPALMAYLLKSAGGEHRDCDNYHHAADLLLAALLLAPDNEETIELRAKIKKLLAITFKDIFGPHKPEVLQLLEEARADYVQLGHQGQEANILQHIGGVYVQLERLAEAEQILTKALNKAQANHDEQLQGWIWDDMANLEIARNEWELALDYARKARDKVLTVQDTEGEADTWLTEARVWLHTEHLEKALHAAKHALNLYTNNKNQRRTIRARYQIANVLLQQGQVDEAVATLQKAIKTARQLDLRRNQALLHLNLGTIELKRHNDGLANQHAVQARALAEGEGLEELVADADELLDECHRGGQKQ